MAEIDDKIQRLISNAKALLDLDKDGALVPHGIGGRAHSIIKALIAAIEQRDQIIAGRDAVIAGLEQFFARDGESSVDHFERVADNFHRETGYLRPGKDCRLHSRDVREAVWDKWVSEKLAAARALSEAATHIDALEKRVGELESERDQARAKAIGECEKIAAYGVARAAHDYHNIGQQEGAYMTATDILISIRSLNSKQTP